MKTVLAAQDLPVCPITGELMADPVVDPDGHSYERNAILDWISRNGTSPVTRAPLRADQLTPNRALREMMEEQGVIPKQPDIETGNTENGTLASPPKFQVSLKANHDAKDELALVTIQVSEDSTSNHRSATVVLVIDVSYSMDSAAVMHGDSEGSAGLSQLDVVKHASRTVIETMDSHDRLAVVAYADSAKLVLPLTPMTKANRTKAWNAVDGLKTCGSTNLYDGLLMAMDLLRSQGDSNTNSNSNILLLTDGQPNIHPPRGELPTLRRYQESHPGFSSCISTFGFGYNLDSKLLHDIAVVGGGHYCFIPDSSFVGTVFVNAAANILATALPRSTLQIETIDNSVEVVDCVSGQNATKTSWGLSIAVPPLLYGQSHDVLIKLKNAVKDSSPIRAILRVPPGSFGLQGMLIPQNTEHAGKDSQAAMQMAKARSALTRSVAKGVTWDTARATLREIQQEISKLNVADAQQERFRALQEDINGQVTEAFTKRDWFKKWGRHYTLSLARAHLLQQCSNFKDPGLQVYATKKFCAIRDGSEEIFCKLPPPTPSRPRDDNFAPLTSMRSYHNSHAPCFARGRVQLANGQFANVGAVKAGDVVVTTCGRSAQVICVVVTECKHGMEKLVELDGGVLVTPWHPVRGANNNEAWAFPADMAEAAWYRCQKVYSFVLEAGASAMRIGPYEAVSLGHGIRNDAVAAHDYLGTERVIRDLSKMEGWSEGCVVLDADPAVRDPSTLLIVGFRQKNHDEQKTAAVATNRELDDAARAVIRDNRGAVTAWA